MEKPDWIPLLKDAAVQQQVAALAKRAAEQGRTLFDYVIRTTAHTPGITSIVLGVKNTGQLAAAIRALEMK
jgi:aryl-alcohol dehydrogenase-like predicted oxidoreductase